MATEDKSCSVLTINLDALVHNYQRLRRMAPAAQMGAVVKANGYGLGAKEVAKALEDAGCAWFFVAHPAEGIALRQWLPEAQVFVLHGAPEGTEVDIADAKLVPVINHPAELRRYAALGMARGTRLRIGLQLDTGMRRLGFSPNELAELDAGLLAPLSLALVMSHLCCAEEVDHPLNEQQRLLFESQCRLLPAAPRSLANSSGIFLGAAYHFDVCRPGVALYGVNPVPGRPNPMEPVVTLNAPVLQVHEIDRPATVGYGATYAVRPGGRIATVPLGYADGFLRSAGSGAKARIGGMIVPIAGRISMDLITLDISSLPPGTVTPGTTAELIFGPNGVDQLAAAAGTIGYEILTRLGTRFVRRYTRSEL